MSPLGTCIRLYSKSSKSTAIAAGHGRPAADPAPDSGERQMPPKSSTQFGRTALPFLAMMGLGSWGLAQFLKMPIDVKDARAKDKRENKEKFDLAKEHEVRPPDHAAPGVSLDSDRWITHLCTLPAQRFKSELGDKVENYENVKIPGAKNPYRVAAD